jgi:hypothetical protein
MKRPEHIDPVYLVVAAISVLLLGLLVLLLF